MNENEKWKFFVRLSTYLFHSFFLPDTDVAVFFINYIEVQMPQ